MLVNVNLDKYHFDSFVEIIKIKNSLFNIIKNKVSKMIKLITRLSGKTKEINNTLLEFNF